MTKRCAMVVLLLLVFALAIGRAHAARVYVNNKSKMMVGVSFEVAMPGTDNKASREKFMKVPPEQTRTYEDVFSTMSSIIEVSKMKDGKLYTATGSCRQIPDKPTYYIVNILVEGVEDYGGGWWELKCTINFPR